MKALFQLLPKFITERIKVLYYNIKISGYKFSIDKKLYKTQAYNWLIKSHSPLYFVTKEIDRYEKFYSVQQNDIVIDAGAYNGVLSLVYSQKAPDGIVYSFEPDKKNLERIGENFRINEFPENIKLNKRGLWSKTGKIIFYEAGSVASSSFYKAENAENIEIDVTCLDDFVEELNIEKLDFIKMDVEGAECEILKGAYKTLNRLRPNLSVASYHLVENELTYKSVEKILNQIKYPYKTIFFEDGEIITYAGPQILNSNE